MTTNDSSTRRDGRIIAVTNQKGGVGKTTTAINLGASIAKAGLKCLVIDMDPQGNASTGLGSLSGQRETTIYDALTGATPISAIVAPTMIENLDLVPGSIDLSGIDVEFAGTREPAFRLRNLLADDPIGNIRQRYDYIFIDCPPSLNLLTINAIAVADAVVVPLQCEFFALEGLTQLLATVRQVQESLNRRLTVHGIVLTMYDRRNRLSSQVAEDVRANLGDVVYETVIPRNVRLSEAPSYAMPVIAYDPGCAGSQAYLNLALEFLKRDGFKSAA